MLKTNILKMEVPQSTALLPLFAWYFVNMADTITTNMIINRGGFELNLIYNLTNSMEVVVLSKWLCVILIMSFLYYKKATNVLWVFSIPVLACVANNLMEILTK